MKTQWIILPLCLLGFCISWLMLDILPTINQGHVPKTYLTDIGGKAASGTAVQEYLKCPSDQITMVAVDFSNRTWVMQCVDAESQEQSK